MDILAPSNNRAQQPWGGGSPPLSSNLDLDLSPTCRHNRDHRSLELLLLAKAPLLLLVALFPVVQVEFLRHSKAGEELFQGVMVDLGHLLHPDVRAIYPLEGSG